MGLVQLLTGRESLKDRVASLERQVANLNAPAVLDLEGAEVEREVKPDKPLVARKRFTVSLEEAAALTGYTVGTLQNYGYQGLILTKVKPVEGINRGVLFFNRADLLNLINRPRKTKEEWDRPEKVEDPAPFKSWLLASQVAEILDMTTNGVIYRIKNGAMPAVAVQSKKGSVGYEWRVDPDYVRSMGFEVPDKDTEEAEQYAHWLSPNEVGELLEVSGDSIGKQCREGKIEAVKVSSRYSRTGQIWKINPDAVQAWMDARDAALTPDVTEPPTEYPFEESADLLSFSQVSMYTGIARPVLERLAMEGGLVTVEKEVSTGNGRTRRVSRVPREEAMDLAAARK